MAEMSRILVARVTKSDRVKSYLDLVRPEKHKEPKKTGQDILNGIIAKALGGNA